MMRVMVAGLGHGRFSLMQNSCRSGWIFSDPRLGQTGSWRIDLIFWRTTNGQSRLRVCLGVRFFSLSDSNLPPLSLSFFFHSKSVDLLTGKASLVATRPCFSQNDITLALYLAFSVSIRYLNPSSYACTNPRMPVYLQWID